MTTIDLNPDYVPPDDAEPRGLSGTLARLISRIELAADHKFSGTTLKHGLMVEVGIGEQFNLRLSRTAITPSLNEWRIVVAYLPEAYKPTRLPEPREVVRSGRHCLEAHWDYQRRML